MPNMATLRRWLNSPDGTIFVAYGGYLALIGAVILLLWVLSHPQ